MADTDGNSSIPELLYHTTLTVVDFHRDTSGSTRDTHVLGTHTTLPAAKAFALRALETLGYKPADFDEYATRADYSGEAAEEWPHHDGVMVYARGPAGHELLVGLDTKPNTESLPAVAADDSADQHKKDTLQLPAGHDRLHYVLQNRTDYTQDQRAAYQTAEIQGCYARRDDALAAARQALQEDRDEYAQYDERGEDQGEDEEWPFGEEVVVHAVAQTGENYTIAVKTAMQAHEKHGKVL
ncbi:uncharacterized protein B0H64DRAFT_103909 [Chaetomium fimeti]|uniref:Uncharacterized protein n=1 Tax=Chaetomium fimeti TaxID=1854472 RepID=A0AAE0HQ27_9PEZI|nr:hypothetical protein B0H64DRAFT_103909 [Chaetomium fimeti]